MQTEMNTLSQQATVAAEDGNQWAGLFRDAITEWSATIDDMIKCDRIDHDHASRPWMMVSDG